MLRLPFEEAFFVSESF